MSLVPFDPRHLLSMAPRLQTAQAGFPGLSAEYGAGLRSGGPCWTIANSYGEPMACGGLFQQWDGRSIAWAFLAVGAPMVEVSRVALTVLESCGLRRVECWVDVDFKAGHRWARLLGFEREGLMRSFSPDGRDHILYARV
jgi:hypothetical protein